MRCNLRPRQLLVLMDFTSTMTVDKPGAGVYIQDCILVIEYLESGRRVRRNFDFLCSGVTNKHDYHFVLQVWVKLFLDEQLNERFDRIDVWTDGGPHHFKTRFCQFMWHSLSTLRFSNKLITHHFFASYHGHSLADGHAAVMKRVLLARYRITELERSIPGAGATWGPSTIEEAAAVTRANCANTEVHVFTDIDRDGERKPKVRAINSLKAMHCFAYCDGLCCATRGTDEGEKEFFQLYK